MYRLLLSANSVGYIGDMETDSQPQAFKLTNWHQQTDMRKRSHSVESYAIAPHIQTQIKKGLLKC
jgi:hypothetical protein